MTPPAAPDTKKIDRAIDQVISALTDKYGKGAIARLSDEGAYAEVKMVVPTGLPSLDAALGIGGLPIGRIIEIFGPEHSLKSTLSKHLAIAAQKAGAVPVEEDIELSGAKLYDEALGMVARTSLAAQPDTLEEVMGHMLTGIPIFQKNHVPSIYLWDSLAASLLKEELESGADETSGYPARAKYLAFHLPQLMTLIKRGEESGHGYVSIVIVNQIRERINAPQFAKKTYAPGGRAIRHYAHVRIEMVPMGQIKGPGDTVVGLKALAKVVKNKLAAPFREALLEFYFNPPRLVDPAAEKKPSRRVALAEPVA